MGGRLATILLIFSSSAGAQAVLRGTVYDRQDAVIPGFIVTATGPDGVRQTTTDSEGAYKLTLPPGTYAVTADTYHKGYWYPVRRSMVSLKGGESREVDLWPNIRILVRFLTVTNRGISEPVILAPKPRYRQYRFSNNPEVKLVVQFATRYDGRRLEGVVVTYGAQTIRADAVHIRRKTISLSGNVRYYAGSQKLVSSKALVRLEADRPSIEINGQQFPLEDARLEELV